MSTAAIEVRWKPAWATGCTARIAVFNCSNGVRSTVRVMKGATLAFQILLFVVVARNLLRNRNQLHDSRGALQLVCMGFCFVGGLHSLSLAAEMPNDVSQEGLLFLVEYCYSLFTALMIGAMGCLNCVWLEVYHKETFPEAEAERQMCLKAMQLTTKTLLSLTILTALATDTALVASPSHDTFLAVAHVQHFVYVLICTVLVPVTILMMRRCVSRGGPVSDKDSLGRLLAAQWLISFLWIFCIFFCMFCGVGGLLSKATNQKPETGLMLAWLSHASFNFSAGGIIGSFSMIMINKPGLLNKVAWLFKPPCCCLVSPLAYASEELAAKIGADVIVEKVEKVGTE